MEKSGSSGKKLEAFFSGKGFYIVLFLCAAVIGVSAWILMSDPGTDVELPITAYDDPLPEETLYMEIQEPDVQMEAPVVVHPVDESETPVSTVIPVEEPVQAWAPEPEAAPGLFVWPVQGEIEVPYTMTSLRYDRTMADWRTHDGIDIAAELGTHVTAIAAGTVEKIYTDDLYGVTMVIDHGAGIKSIYSNLAETPTVYEGSSVSVGEVIGAVGNTAICETGEVTHLHLNMTLDGQSVDPCEYLP